MTAALELVTAPAVLPLDLDEVKAHVRMDVTDEDTLLNAMISAAVSHVDGLGDLGRAMITQTWAQYENQSPGYVRLRMTPVQALTAVEYYDADGTLQTATLSDYELWRDGDHMLCKPKDGKSWPQADNRPDAIKISYTAGFGDAATDVPEGIRQALLMLIAHMHENRSSSSGVKMTDVPMGYEFFIGNERLGWYG